MKNNNTVTCSFSMDRDVYNAFKSIITGNGENVKGNIVRYMQSVIDYGIPNAETIAAIEEVQKMKSNPKIGKTYNTVDEMMSWFYTLQEQELIVIYSDIKKNRVSMFPSGLIFWFSLPYFLLLQMPSKIM